MRQTHINIFPNTTTELTMKLNLLQSFLAVARVQSITGATSLLHISQPALSRQIKELEDELGTELFHRGNRRVTLTPAGMLLQKRAKQIVELVDKTTEEFATSDRNISGAVYIAGGETHVFRALAKSVRQLLQQHPNIHINLFSGNADAVTERLDRGGVDFGLVIEPADVSKYDYIRLPSVDRWGVLMRKDSPLAAFEAIEPKDLWDVPLIQSRQALKGGQLTSWLKIDSESLDVVASYDLIYNASLLVEAGVGYALCLDGIINTTGDTELCFRPLYPALESHVDIIWKKHQLFSKASELFLEAVRTQSALGAH